MKKQTQNHSQQNVPDCIAIERQKVFADVKNILEEMSKRYKTKDCISDCCKTCRVCITDYLIARLKESK